MKRSGVIYVASPLMTPKQWRVLEWFCKEVSKAVFLEVTGLTFIPQAIGLNFRPSVLLLIIGLIFALTFLFVAVKLAKKGEEWT